MEAGSSKNSICFFYPPQPPMRIRISFTIPPHQPHFHSLLCSHRAGVVRSVQRPGQKREAAQFTTTSIQPRCLPSAARASAAARSPHSTLFLPGTAGLWHSTPPPQLQPKQSGFQGTDRTTQKPQPHFPSPMLATTPAFFLAGSADQRNPVKLVVPSVESDRHGLGSFFCSVFFYSLCVFDGRIIDHAPALVTDDQIGSCADDARA